MGVDFYSNFFFNQCVRIGEVCCDKVGQVAVWRCIEADSGVSSICVMLIYS